MAGHQQIVQKQSEAFANSDKPAQPQRQTNFSQINAKNPKKPQLDRMLENTLHSGSEAVAKSLTYREKQILQLIVAGNTNKQIAEKLARTQRTVEYHRNHLMHKFGAHNAAELVKHAIDLGFV